nr:MAG TPA: hypothetical protein [Caudoviricetes sp.]
MYKNKTVSGPALISTILYFLFFNVKNFILFISFLKPESPVAISLHLFYT